MTRSGRTATTANSNIPRTDVGTAGLTVPLTTVVLMFLDGEAYNTQPVIALVAGLIVFAAGYLPRRHKNFVMSVTAVLATLVAAVIGKMFYGVEWDNATVSVAASTFVTAALAYALPPNAQSEVIATSGYSDSQQF